MELQAAIVLVVIFFLLLAYGIPVSFCIITAALATITMFMTPEFGMFISAQKMVGGIDSFSLLAVPFFILAGLLMSNGGIARRLVNLALLVLGKVPGSLALTNIAGNAMFGSISGSGIAAATAIGGVMNPLEKEHGYDEKFAAAVNIATAPVGQLIPPTTAFIIYSAASGGISVAALFMAGWIPGLLWAALCMIVAFAYGYKHGYVIKGEKLTANSALKVIWDAIPSLFLIVIIIGGILSGKFTATEASGVAVVYALLLSVVLYKSIKVSELMGIFVETAVMTTIVMLIIGASSVLSFVMSFTGLPQAISNAMLSISDNPIIILLIINIILLIVGTFMDMAPALLIFTPIFLPIIKNIGMDTIQFGVMMVMNLAIGTITPPVGNVLFVGCSVAKLQVEDVIKDLIPFFVAIVIALLFVTFVPSISLWLPNLLSSLGML
ncbi:MAG: TRAP transporter large permease [Lachnospiraceae bacterium]